MLIVIDIGNTHTVCGIYRARRLVKTWRVPTQKPIVRFVERIIGGIPRGEIEGICISSVVPWVDRPLSHGLRRKFGVRVLFATVATVGIPIARYRRKEIGADRLVDALAAYHRYKCPLIIVDFGTATTFDVVTAKGEYAGGAIAPGIHLANRSLYEFTAKLPRAPIKKTRKIIGHRTIASMQGGVFHGYVGLVNHLVRRIAREMRARPKIIATGGLARLIAPETDVIERIHPDLTLEGLRLVWEKSEEKRGEKAEIKKKLR